MLFTFFVFCQGTDAIQGIALNFSLIKDLLLHADTFTKMKTLRFLKFHNTLGQSSSNTYLDLPATLEPFSDQLRYIEWIGYPFQSPSPFFAKFLVEIPMPHSKLKQLWQGIQVKKDRYVHMFTFFFFLFWGFSVVMSLSFWIFYRNLTIYRKLSLVNANSLKKFQICPRHLLQLMTQPKAIQSKA